MAKQNNRKRSIYMDQAVSDEIQRLADAHDRSLSLEISWLVNLGLRLLHRFPDAPVIELEDAEQRVYFYPTPALTRRLDRSLTALNERSRKRNEGKDLWHWSFSAFARVLLDKGLTVERWIERQLEANGRKLAGEAVGSSPRGYAMHLMVTHTARQIAEIPGEPEAGVLARWNIDVDSWLDAVAAAFEARTRIEQLAAGDEE